MKKLKSNIKLTKFNFLHQKCWLKNYLWYKKQRLFKVKSKKNYYFLDSSASRAYYSKFSLNRFKLKQYQALGLLDVSKK